MKGVVGAGREVGSAGQEEAWRGLRSGGAMVGLLLTLLAGMAGQAIQRIIKWLLVWQAMWSEDHYGL